MVSGFRKSEGSRFRRHGLRNSRGQGLGLVLGFRV